MSLKCASERQLKVTSLHVTQRNLTNATDNFTYDVNTLFSHLGSLITICRLYDCMRTTAAS